MDGHIPDGPAPLITSSDLLISPHLSSLSNFLLYLSVFTKYVPCSQRDVLFSLLFDRV